MTDWRRDARQQLPGGRVAFDAVSATDTVPGALSGLTSTGPVRLRGRVLLSSDQLEAYREARRPDDTIVSVMVDGREIQRYTLNAARPEATIDLSFPAGSQSVSFKMVDRGPRVDPNHLVFINMQLVTAP